jgi:Interferon-induced transmembrane protein
MQGQYAEAQAAANNAKKWAIISAIIAGVILVGYLAFWLIVFLVGVGSGISHMPSTTTTTY